MYEEIFKVIPEPCVIARVDGGLVAANASARSIFGSDSVEEFDSLFDILSKEDIAHSLRLAGGSTGWLPAAATIIGGPLKGLRQNLQMRALRLPDTDPMLILVIQKNSMAAFREHTDLIGRLNAQLSEQRKLRAQLQASVQNEKYLHGELIHRVKNNLTLLSSLVRHQSRTAETEEAREALDAIGLRIRSVALVHQLLDRNKTLEVLNASDLINELCDLLKDSLLPDNIELVCQVEALDLHNEDATSLCLLVNELMTNAIKHAFKDRSGGKIELRFAKNGVEKMELRVRDDGGGIKLGDEDSGAMGMSIIHALSDNLNGDLHHHTDSGTEWTLVFLPKELSQKAAE